MPIWRASDAGMRSIVTFEWSPKSACFARLVWVWIKQMAAKMATRNRVKNFFCEDFVIQ